MVEFEPNRAYGFLGNRISDDNLGTERRKEGRKEGQTDREMVNYSMMRPNFVMLFINNTNEDKRNANGLISIRCISVPDIGRATLISC